MIILCTITDIVQHTGKSLKLGPVLEPKYQKNLETFFLEAFLVAKPGRVTVRLLPNRMIRER